MQSPFVSVYAPYERDFVLVQWDQRGTGRTYGRYGDATPDLTLGRLIEDGIELAAHLQRRFGRTVVVLGHSWGTAIATGMVGRRPDLFSAYVGTGQIASWAEPVRWQFEFLRTRAAAAGQEDMRISTSRSPGRCASTSVPDAAWLAGLPDLAVRSTRAEEFEAIVAGMTWSARALLEDRMQVALSATALSFELPYYIVQGRDDVATPTVLAAAYFERIATPRKRMVVIEGAGHFALVTHPQVFVPALRDMLGP